MKREELLRSEEWYTTEMQLALFQQLDLHLEEAGLSRKEFAKQHGLSKKHVKRAHNGKFKGSLRELVRIALAANLAPKLIYRDLDEYVEEDAKAHREGSERRIMKRPKNKK